MHRRTFLQSLCILAAAATIGHVPISAPPAPALSGTWAEASFLQPGDVFTIEGYYVINPPSCGPAPLQQFVVLGADHARHSWDARFI